MSKWLDKKADNITPEKEKNLYFLQQNLDVADEHVTSAMDALKLAAENAQATMIDNIINLSGAILQLTEAMQNGISTINELKEQLRSEWVDEGIEDNLYEQAVDELQEKGIEVDDKYRKVILDAVEEGKSLKEILDLFE